MKIIYLDPGEAVKIINRDDAEDNIEVRNLEHGGLSTYKEI